MTIQLLDGPFYLVICGDAAEDAYTPQRMASDCTWARTVADIAEMQFDDLLQVIEVGTGRDMTEQAMRAAMNVWAQVGEPISRCKRQIIELHVGIAAANSFRSAA